MGSKKRNYHHFESNLVYLIAFVIPFVVLIAIYFARGIFPFGDKCYLRSDMYHQYLPFYSELWYKLRSGSSLFYSTDIGMGVNFTALYAYYLSCPLNWFIFIFPHKYLIEVMNALIILKISLSSVSFTYYITKHFKNKNILIALFGMFYGLSGYLAAYSWNIMWLDCVLLLPLIILGLELLVSEHKYMLYTVSLGLAILSNYYISIMICLTLVIYFVILFIRTPLKGAKAYFRCIGEFALFSILAGGLAAVLLLPEIYALGYTVSSKISFPKSLTEYFPIVQMLTRHLINIETHLALEHHPNIYCGVAVFLLVPLYVMNRKIDTKEKIGKLVLLFVFLVAFNMNIPNFIWHGLHFPNSLPCRQSFIYIFFLLTICYDAFRGIAEYSKKELTAALWIAFGFLLFVEQTLSKDVVDFKVIYISGLFIGAYMLLAYIYRAKKVPYLVFIFMFFTVGILECAINYEDTAVGTTSRSAYLKDNEDIEALLATADRLEDGFYRVEKYSGLRTKNDGAWNGYHSASTFSSTSNGALSKLYGKLGMESSTNAYSYNGATFLSSALLNVKYVLSDRQVPEHTLLSYIDNAGDYYLYKNNYTLPLGFVVTKNITDNWDAKSSNPFSVQNSFIAAATGVTDVFVPLTTSSVSSSAVEIHVGRAQQVYFKTIGDKFDNVQVYINDNSRSYSVKHNHIVDLGVLNADDSVRVTVDSSDASLAINAYTINQTAFIDAINQMSTNALVVNKMDDTHIEGHVRADYDGYMILSVPFDRGWNIYVDGEKVSPMSLEDAFLMLEISAGEHDIVMKYVPEGFKIGLVITIICVIILCMLYIGKRFFHFGKKNTEATDEELPLDDSILAEIAVDAADMDIMPVIATTEIVETDPLVAIGVDSEHSTDNLEEPTDVVDTTEYNHPIIVDEEFENIEQETAKED